MTTYLPKPPPAALLPTPSLPRTRDRDLAARLNTVIDCALIEERIVGLVALVARDGGLVYRRAAGFADRESEIEMREDAVFRLSSVTKPVVAAAALALVEQGHLRLDDPVTKWLPDFRPRLPDGREPVISVRHLLSHTSGLTYPFNEPPNGSYHRAGISSGLDQPGLSLDENLRRLGKVPLRFAPGTAWEYSIGLDVLGGVLERAAGKPLPDLVAALITRPLGMRDTIFSVGQNQRARLTAAYDNAMPRPARMTALHTLPFESSQLVFAPDRMLDPASYPSGGAGMVGTASEFLAFLEVLRTGGGPILRPETVRLMTSNAIGTVPTLRPGTGFSLCSAIVMDAVLAQTPRSVGTWTWGGVYGHHWFVDPSRNLTVVVFTNTAVAGMMGTFPDQVAQAVYGV